MDIRLNIGSLVSTLDTLIHQWQIVVNDHVHLEDIDSSCNDVRGDQDLMMFMNKGISE